MLTSDATSTRSQPSDGDARLPLQVVHRQPNRESTSPKSHASKLFVGLPALCLAALAAGYALPRYGQQPAVSEPSQVMAVAELRGVVGLGRLEPEGEVISVAAPSGAGEARVDQLLVEEGDRVRKDDILAVLDNKDRLDAARQVAFDTVEQSRAKLSQTLLEVETRSAQLQAALRSAEARLSVAKSKLARSETLLASRATSKEAFDDSKLSVTTAAEAVREANSRLERYTAGTEGELIDITVARRDLTVAQASLRQAEANLEQAIVRAPVDGTILELICRVGERIGQSPLLEMGATDQMMARVEIYESDIPRVQVGQQATLSASPLPRPLTGKVDRISRLVQKQEIIEADPAANTDSRVVEAWVRLDRESSRQAAQLVNLQVRVELQP